MANLIDGLNEHRFINVERNLGDDDLAGAFSVSDDFGFATDDNFSTAFPIDVL